MSLPGQPASIWTPATLEDALSNSVASPLFCVEVTCGKHEKLWTIVSAGPSYSVSQSDKVVNVKVNGIALQEEDSLIDTTANANTWFQDASASLLYVHLGGDQNPNTRGITVETFLRYRFSDIAADAGGYYWEPRLADLPSLSRKNPIDFKGLVQITGGKLTLLNEDGFFTDRFSQNWDAGETKILMGSIGLAYANFRTLATFSNYGASVNDKSFMLDVKEAKVKIDKLYPQVVYDVYTYPAIRERDIGRGLQRVYGVHRSVDPVCIDVGSGVFQVAGHQIKSFDGVRVKDPETEEWTEVDFDSTDLDIARFSLDSADWNADLEVAVDFSGMPRLDGSLMDNPSEQLSDFLQELNERVDYDAFEDARLWYDAGHTYHPNGDTTERISVASLAVNMDTPVSALTTINAMLANCRAYLNVNAEGEFAMSPWRTYQGSSLQVIKDEDMIGGLVRVPQQSTLSNKISRSTVNYGFRKQEGWNENYSYEVPENQFTRDQKDTVAFVFDSLLYVDEHAQYLAQALVNEHNVDPLQYSTRMKWRPFPWNIGDSLRIESDIHGLDVVAEIVGLNIHINTRNVDLILGNLRGNDESMGFWVDSGDLTPSGASLAWDPGDSEQQYRRHESGHWHNEKDQASNSPLTAADCTVSRWF